MRKKDTHDKSRKPVPEAVQTLLYKIEVEGLDYALTQWDWKELKAVDRKLYDLIVQYRKRKGRPDIDGYLDRTYGTDA